MSVRRRVLLEVDDDMHSIVIPILIMMLAFDIDISMDVDIDMRDGMSLERRGVLLRGTIVNRAKYC